MILFLYRALDVGLGVIGASATICVKKTDSILAGLIVLPLADVADADVLTTAGEPSSRLTHRKK